MSRKKLIGIIGGIIAIIGAVWTYIVYPAADDDAATNINAVKAIDGIKTGVEQIKGAVKDDE